MRKIFSTFLVFLAFIGFLLLPVSMSLHSSMMMEMGHGSSEMPCLQYCLSDISYSEGISIGNILPLSLEVFIQKAFLSTILSFVLPLTSLYILILYAPPNLKRSIKNYSYSSLRGIVISTT